MAKKILSTDSRGNYQRDCGWKKVGLNYRQHRFYLGRDRGQAVIDTDQKKRANSDHAMRAT